MGHGAASVIQSREICPRVHGRDAGLADDPGMRPGRSRGRSASLSLARVGAINWGDAPTWLGAIFAAAAATAAVWTLTSQRQQIREQREFIAEQSATMELERAELRAVADDRRVAQARRVRMACDRVGPNGTDPVATALSGYDHWVVRITNTSDAPLHNVAVRFLGSAGGRHRAAEVIGADGTSQGFPARLVGPDRLFTFISPGWNAAGVDDHRPSAWFTDDAGVRWHLDEHGKLEAHPEGEPE